MTRRSFLSAVAVNLVAAGVALLAVPSSRAAEPASKLVRVGYVDLESRSTAIRGWPAFWQRMPQAVLVVPGALTNSHRRHILALAAKHRLPDLYGLPENILLRADEVIR